MTPKCPRCFTSKLVVPIVYGFPHKAFLEKWASRELYLDSSESSDLGVAPAHYCKRCGIKFDEVGQTFEVPMEERL